MVMYKGVAKKKKASKENGREKKDREKLGRGGGMVDDTFKMKVSRDWE